MNSVLPSELYSFSVIIPTYNGAEKLRSLLFALQYQDYPLFEVIVVVDGSKDHTPTVIKEVKATILKYDLFVHYTENKGQAAARNFGAEKARYPYLLFFDDDMLPERNCVRKHLNFYKERYKPEDKLLLIGNSSVNPNINKTEIQRYRIFTEQKWSLTLPAQLGPMEKPFLPAHHFSIPTLDFREIGGFDQRLRDNEDGELADRLSKAGYTFYYDPSIVAHHVHYPSFRALGKRLRQYRIARRQWQTEKGIFSEPEFPFWKKSIIHWIGRDYWLEKADKGFFEFLPLKYRYPLYDRLLYAYSLNDDSSSK